MFSRYGKYFLLAFFVVSTVLVISQTAWGCSCGPQPTVLDSYNESDVVVILRALSVEKAQDTEKRHYVNGVRSTTMRVEKVFKGALKVRDEIVFGQGGGADCIWTFSEEAVGHEFLFYLNRPEKFDRDYLDHGLWYAVTCGRSTGLGAATDDLLYLEKIDKVRGKTRISGTLGGWPTPPELVVEARRVKIIGVNKTYEVKTDRHGVFEIYDLPPGKYLIEPEMPRGWKIDPYMVAYSPSLARSEENKPEFKTPRQVAILLEPKKHAGVDLAFEIDNVIRGKVLGPNGKPMPRVCVNVLAPEQEESWGAHDCTDEQGHFEITSVPAGQYVIVANQSGKLSDREPFPRLYYPNVSERERAVVITIGPGDEINDINIVIPKLAERITIDGVLLYSDGKPVVEKWVKFKATSTDKTIDGEVNEQTDASGRFSMKVLKGLTGDLSAEDWLLDGLYKNCPKVDELLAKSGRNNTTVYSNTIRLEANQNFYNLELTLPFPLCEKTTNR